MQRLPRANSWYGFTTLSKDWGSINFDGYIESSIGRVELPVFNGVRDTPLYLVGARYGSKLLMAGQSQNGNGTLFYTDGIWYQLGVSFGVSPCAFSQDGRFFYFVTGSLTGMYRDNENGALTPFETPFFVDGLRAVIPPTNKMILGNTTIYSPVYDLHEYIDFENGLVVGQGSDGLVCRYNGIRYLVEPGDTRFIRAMFDGVNIALDSVNQVTKQNVQWWLDTAELVHFPISGDDEEIPVIGKKCYVTWFEFNQFPPTPPPGNSLLTVRWPDQNHTILKQNGSQFAAWIEGSSVGEINQKVAASQYPCLAYWDSRNWPQWPVLRAQDWLGLQAYCSVNEDSQFEVHMRQLIESVPAQFTKIALVCQCYTSNASLTANLRGLVPVYARLARDYPRITMLAPFSDQNRATGLNDHPEVRPDWQRLYDGVTGIPDGELPMPIDWARINQYGADRWAQLEVQRISAEIDAENGVGACRPFQQDTFKTICRELYCDQHVGFDWFWKAGVPDYNNPQDVSDKLQHIGEDIIVDLSTNGYRDIVVGMGLPSATWGHGGPDTPITPGDQGRCGPPNCASAPAPDLSVFFLSYQTVARRSDPKGLTVYFEAASSRNVVKFRLELLGAPEVFNMQMLPPFPPDGRYFRAIAWKPTMNGVFTPRITVWDDLGNEATADGINQITVTE